MTTKISWCDETINPIVGCSKISAGCQNCYAETMARRLALMNMGQYIRTTDEHGHWNGDSTFVPTELEKPTKWKRPRSIFISSMGDLFHESVWRCWIDEVLLMVAQHPQHTFIMLTKRPERMKEYFDLCRNYSPLQNLVLGVSVENQETADQRIPVLLGIPAARRFISLEPMIGPVDIWGWYQNQCQAIPFKILQPRLDGVILGGESGPKARTMDPDWARSVRDQCATAGIPFMLKQYSSAGSPGRPWEYQDETGHPLLDGRTHTDLAWTLRK